MSNLHTVHTVANHTLNAFKATLFTSQALEATETALNIQKGLLSYTK